MPTDSKRGKALTAAIKNDSVKDVAKELAEQGIEAILDSDALKAIPFVNAALAFYDAKKSITDHIFSQKLLRFMADLSQITREERDNMVRRLEEDDGFSGRVGESIIEIIDRIESDRKPEMVARCFKAYAKSSIRYLQLRQLLTVIERLPSYEVDEVRDFVFRTVKRDGDDVLMNSLVVAGLVFEEGSWKSGFKPTPLGQLFLHLELDR